MNTPGAMKIKQPVPTTSRRMPPDKELGPAVPPPPDSRQEEITALAYQIWRQAGCPAGRDLEHWLLAEAQLRQHSNGDGPAAAQPRPAATAKAPGTTRRRRRQLLDFITMI